MIVGIGCDTVNIQRIEKSSDFLRHFKCRILGDEELKEVEAKNLTNNHSVSCVLAKYYAGKEAFVKALGTGFRDGIFLRDIQILHNDFGKPYLKIKGQALNILQKSGKNLNLQISLSDDYPWAQAFVIIEKI